MLHPDRFFKGLNETLMRNVSTDNPLKQNEDGIKIDPIMLEKFLSVVIVGSVVLFLLLLVCHMLPRDRRADAADRTIYDIEEASEQGDPSAQPVEQAPLVNKPT